jgi:hypothetical protein
LRWSRLLIWLAFALLAAYRWYGVPFFAVVAGPISALNFQDWAAGLRGATEPPPGLWRTLRQEWAALVKVGVLMVVLVVLDKVVSRIALHYGLPLYDRPTDYVVFASLLIGIFFFVITPLIPYLDKLFTTWPMIGRLVTVLAGIALLLVAWPGLLQAGWQDAYLARRVAWSADPDPSLVQAARRLRELHEQLPQAAGRGFATQAKVANYCAYFCPEEKGFLDHRFLLFPEVAATYIDLRGALDLEELTADAEPSEAPSPDAKGGQADQARANRQMERMDRLRQQFRDQKINHVVLTGQDPLSILGPVQQLLSNPKEWPLLYEDGRTVIFGWRDPEETDRAAPPAADAWTKLVCSPARSAFGPVPDEARIPKQPPAEPIAVPDWARYMAGPAPRALPSDEAFLDLLNFDALTPLYHKRTFESWQFLYAAGMVGSTTPAPGPVASPAFFAFRACLCSAFYDPKTLPPVTPAMRRSQVVSGLATRLIEDAFGRGQDEGPPALLILAVRAARRAIAESPEDPLAYVRLEQAYRTLTLRTRERAWIGRMRPLAVLRHIEMATALQHALTIQPDLAVAHGELGQLYVEFNTYSQSGLGFLDLALKHRTQQLKLVQDAGRGPRESEKDYDDRVKDLEKLVKDLEKAVQTQQNQYEVRSANVSKPYPKAVMALSYGLAEQALNVLLESDVTEFGKPGARLQLELLLAMGRAEDARRGLEDPTVDIEELKQGMETTRVGPYMEVPAYAWYMFLRQTACGDYAGADRQLQEIIQAANVNPFVLQLLSTSLLESQHKPLAWMALARKAREELIQASSAAMLVRLQTRADLTVFRGLLALEVGDNAAAEEFFRAAYSASYPPSRYLPFLSLLGSTSPLEAAMLVLPSYHAGLGPVYDFSARPIATRYVQLMEEARESQPLRAER